MRMLLLALAVTTHIIVVAQTSTQAPPRPQKVLTPEQAAYKKAIDDFGEQSIKLHAAAVAAYDAEMAREKAPRCPNADNTYAINMCLAHENDLTDANYKAFVQAIRAMLALTPPQTPDMPKPYEGPTGPGRTSATETAAFDQAEAAWQAYFVAECSGAVDTHWRGGTIVNAMDAECGLRLARARMHELDLVYSITHPM